MSRWEPSVYQIGDLPIRVRQGVKGKDDLVMEMFVNGRWSPPGMELCFFMVDFYSWNEDELLPERPHWRSSGPGYFLNECARAVRDGWRVPAERIRRQRRKS